MIRACGYLENVWPLSVSLARKERRAMIEKAEGKLLIRDGGWQHPDIGKSGSWAHMRVAVQKANRLILESLPQWEISTITLDELGADQATAWAKGGTEIEVHAAVVTNPGAWLFAGTERSQVPVGAIVAYERTAWHSAINDGTTPRIHMVIVLKKREAEPEQPL